MALRLLAAAFAVALIMGITFAGSPSSVSAHEHRTVAENYEFTVGWSAEPAIGGQPNAVWVQIVFFEGGVPEEHDEEEEESEEEAVEGEPLEGAEEGLGVEVQTGGGAYSIELPLEPAFGEVGVYESTPIIPAPGDYTFIFTGTLPDGTEINESFDSGPETFATVEDPASLEFPPPPDDSSDASASDSSDDDDNSTIAIIIGLVALVAAAVAIILGLIAFARKASSS
jgi:hypothetical protein